LKYLREWDKLPDNMRLDEVRKYYDVLKSRESNLLFKRFFDIVASSLLLIVLSPFFLVLAVFIKADSPGPVFYRQERVTQYGKIFRIHKFRSMCDKADERGSLVTVNNDSRITRVGRFIRKYRLDEISQLIDVLAGNMTFVGTRPEVPSYVASYTPEMMATLLLPAGITSEASIRYKDEEKLLDGCEDVNRTYVEQVLPAKMVYNLQSLIDFSLFDEFKTLVRTALAMCGKDYD